MTKYLGPKVAGTALSTQDDVNSLIQASATPPSSPSTGDLWLDSDNGSLYIYYDSSWITPVSIGAGISTSSAQTITGTNTEGSSNNLARADHNHAIGSGVIGTSQLSSSVGNFSAWTSYTPTLTASTTNPTLGTGSTAEGFYCQIGKSVFWRANITFGTASVNAGSGFYFISLPVTAKAAGFLTPMGSFVAEDVSTGTRYMGAAAYDNTTRVAMQRNAAGAFQATDPMTWAASDYIRIQGVYEAA